MAMDFSRVSGPIPDPNRARAIVTPGPYSPMAQLPVAYTVTLASSSTSGSTGKFLLGGYPIDPKLLSELPQFQEDISKCLELTTAHLFTLRDYVRRLRMTVWILIFGVVFGPPVQEHLLGPRWWWVGTVIPLIPPLTYWIFERWKHRGRT